MKQRSALIDDVTQGVQKVGGDSMEGRHHYGFLRVLRLLILSSLNTKRDGMEGGHYKR